MMKKYFMFLLSLAATFHVNSQPADRKKDRFFNTQNEIVRLRKIIDAVSHNSNRKSVDSSGIFQRIINKIDVDQTETYSKEHQFLPYKELNYIHLKFSDFDSVRLDDNGTPFSVGKVFLGERYIESDYFDRFKKPADYKADNDGFYYFCKIYFDTKNLEQRLIIYPLYLSNICKKYLHLNDKPCLNGDSDAHENSVRALLSIPDTYYGDFISENEKTSNGSKNKNLIEEIQKFAGHNRGKRVNFHELFMQTDSAEISQISAPFKPRIRKNSFKVFVNYSTYMKIFRLSTSQNENNQLTEATLSLINSKKANSEDFIDNMHYDYNFRPYYGGVLEQEISEYVEFTNNEANKRLVFSELPDDVFIPGKKRVFNQISFYTSEIEGIEGCRSSGSGFVKCLEKLEIDKMRVLDNERKSLTTFKRKADSLSKKIVTKIELMAASLTERIKEENLTITSLQESKKSLIELGNQAPKILDKIEQELTPPGNLTADSINEKLKPLKLFDNSITLINELIRPKLQQSVKPITDLNFTERFIAAASDSAKASMISAYREDLTKQLIEARNEAGRLLDQAIDKSKNEITAYEREINYFKNDKNFQSSDMKPTSIDSTYLQLVSFKTIADDSLKVINNRIDRLKDDLSKINREISNANVDQSEICGFIYLDHPLGEKFRKFIQSSGKVDAEKTMLLHNLFQNSFYVRRTLPEVIQNYYHDEQTNAVQSNNMYTKGEIREIYEPFNFDFSRLKKNFKAMVRPRRESFLVHNQ